MSAERLREAADRLDELAKAATPGPWEAIEAPENAWHDHEIVGPVVKSAGKRSEPIAAFTCGPIPDAAYIAAMHPGVGKALAAWLREVGLAYRQTVGNPVFDREAAHALAVADAVLGGAA